MCRIAGIIGFKPLATDKFKQEKNNILDILKHGGPDDKGYFADNYVCFLHRRLSIIDLSEGGHQPMISDDKRFVLAYNGELYNYVSIKNQLINLGYSFNSSSDTEVILKSFQHWGAESFQKFNGIFAFSVYDKLEGKVYLVRDHAGIKPLYYSISGNNITFSSEVRVFKEINPKLKYHPHWQYLFLSFGFIPAPYTYLQDVYHVPKGSYAQIDIRTQKFTIHKYHTFNFSETIQNEDIALKAVRETVLSSVERQMVSDAPIGVFLSGGIDSSLLALLANEIKSDKLNTLSVNFKESSFDESKYQYEVLSRMKAHNHHSIVVSKFDFMDALPDIFRAMDQPSIDGVNSYFVSKVAAQNGLKAVLSGCGSDELFGGYPSFQRISWLKLAKLSNIICNPINKIVDDDKLRRFSFFNLKTDYKDYLFLRGIFNPRRISKLLDTDFEKVASILNNYMPANYPDAYNYNLASYLESNIYLENQLLRDTDYMSMWHSLEVRVPFLDKELMELIYSISIPVKANFSQPKYLLTKAFSDILPRNIIFRQKQGFTFPFKSWMDENMHEFIPLLPNIPYVNNILSEYRKGKLHWSKVWALVVMKNFMDKENISEFQIHNDEYKVVI